MKNRNLFALVLLLSPLLTLGACGGDVKETLGMRRSAPDEFAVERRPKLDVPPEFKLRPPVEGDSGLKESAIRDQLRTDVLGASTPVLGGSAESVLLQKTGAQSADSQIRTIISKEYEPDDKGLLDRLENLTEKDSNKTLVDADKERSRINENKKAGKSIDDGASATRSEDEGKSIVDKIFGE